ncbi:hypothetical protein PUMCH_002159 [Australozyma saopauloensis]|uniref:VASt domain-containing protein n=1 Tax=Australozyma saopauloensis TaxID=291208 RepID=A0AAX4H9C2_9ASCO|nr:hypothetical protein PUMCH_002159 [[Candida] saopauloensis]
MSHLHTPGSSSASNDNRRASYQELPPQLAANKAEMRRHSKLLAQSGRIDPNKSTELLKLESNGLISSLLSVAQNAATIIGKLDKSSETLQLGSNLSKKLDFSIGAPTRRPLAPNLPSVLTITGAELDATLSAHSNPQEGADSLSKRQSSLLASNVHFEPLNHSPINTLGNGDLSLLHFEKKQPLERAKLPDHKSATTEAITSTTDDTLNRKPTVTSNKKVSRRKSIASSTDDAKVSMESSDIDKQSVHSTSLLFDDDEGSGESENAFGATKKKAQEFKSVFKTIPPQEKLVATFSCALSKEILVQGKFYLSQNYICFNSNILGWVTNLVIPLQEVIQIEKKSTVLVFPNGMVITTLHQKYVFATFHARDAVFDLITKVWKKSLQNDRAVKKAPKKKQRITSRANSNRKLVTETSEWSDDEGLFSDPDDDLNLLPLSDLSSDDDNDNVMTRNLAKKKTKTIKSDEVSDHESHTLDFEVDVDAEGSSIDTEDLPKRSKKGADSSFKGFSNPGPAKHSPTSFEHQKSNSDVHIIDQKFNAPLGVVFSMLYGPDNSFYVKSLEAQKNFDISKEKITELSNEQKDRVYSYTKPLSGPIGPKQTKCNITESLETCDFDSYCEVLQITQTPDVPLGNSFKIKTVLYFTWAENNSTKMTVYTSIEWSAKSWIKGAIEKGSIDGQKQSMKALSQSITDALASSESSSLGHKKKRRLATANNIPQVDHKEEVTEENAPSTLLDVILQLMEKIGALLGVNVPMLSTTALGGVVLLLISLLYTSLLMWMTRGKPGVVLGRGAGSNMIEINGRPFNLVPTAETYLSDSETRKEIESKMWDWIISRTGGDLNVSKKMNRIDLPGSDQAGFEEIVGLTRKRLDEVYFNLL